MTISDERMTEILAQLRVGQNLTYDNRKYQAISCQMQHSLAPYSGFYDLGLYQNEMEIVVNRSDEFTYDEGKYDSKLHPPVTPYVTPHACHPIHHGISMRIIQPHTFSFRNDIKFFPVIHLCIWVPDKTVHGIFQWVGLIMIRWLLP